MQLYVHIFFHLLFPLGIAWIFFRTQYVKVWFIFLATMLVDADHLLATPIYDASRCSIGFHPLHSYWAIGIYFFLLIPSKTRIIAIGLLMHMATDRLDCFLKTMS